MKSLQFLLLPTLLLLSLGASLGSDRWLRRELDLNDRILSRQSSKLSHYHSALGEGVDGVEAGANATTIFDGNLHTLIFDPIQHCVREQKPHCTFLRPALSARTNDSRSSLRHNFFADRLQWLCGFGNALHCCYILRNVYVHN